MRFTVRLAVALVLLMLASVAPVEAKKPLIIAARLTFHNAAPRRKTCNEKRQTAKMAAINRGKTSPLMGRRIIPFAYRDKRSGKKVLLKLPQRRIGDVMGPDLRARPEYHIDYYLSGSMPAKYEKCNATVWYCKVI